MPFEQSSRNGLLLKQIGRVRMPQILFDGNKDFVLGNQFVLETLRRGVHMHPWHNMFLSTAHGFAEIDRVLEATDEGGRRAAAVYTLIGSCKLNDVNPQAWLAFVLVRLPDHPAKAIDELPPRNWKIARDAAGQPTPGYRRSLNEPPSIAQEHLGRIYRARMLPLTLPVAGVRRAAAFLRTPF
jgi:IS66 C-terminal element